MTQGDGWNSGYQAGWAKLFIRRTLAHSRIIRQNHPRRPRGSQSGWEKRRNESFKHRRKSLWVLTLTGPFPNGQVNAGSWLGPKNALYYCAQSANSIFRVLLVSLYTTDFESIMACLAHAQKKCTQSGNFQFDINSPFQNTVYPKTKDVFPNIGTFNVHELFWMLQCNFHASV